MQGVPWADPEYRGAIIKILEMLTAPSKEEEERLQKERDKRMREQRLKRNPLPLIGKSVA